MKPDSRRHTPLIFSAIIVLILAASRALAQSSMATVAGGGSNAPTALTADIGADPISAVVDSLGNMYIAAGGLNQVFKVDTSGNLTVVAGNGTGGFSGDGGPATSASLAEPSGLALDSAGNLYIIDAFNQRIRKVTTSGYISTVAGNGQYGFSGDGYYAIYARLALAVGYSTPLPTSLAVDSAGNIYIADPGNNRIRKVVPTTGYITTIAGNGTAGYSGDGLTANSTSTELSFPLGVALDGSNNLYIADTDNQVIREIVASTGVINTVAGNGTAAYSGDGGAATSASLDGPRGVSTDSSANLYIADTRNNVIRKVTAATGVITTLAGSGVAGFSGEGTLALRASLNHPRQTNVDANGNLFIADAGNGRIREVLSATGNIATVAGGGTGGDGAAATSALLADPFGVGQDNAGNIYIADTVNQRVRRVDTSGNISTVAGTGIRGTSGDGGAATSATLRGPFGLAVDGAGDFYIADGDANVREVVVATGSISTVAGNGTVGFSGDGSAATSASLDTPLGLAVDNAGNFYIADAGNNRIRKVDANGTITTVAGNGTAAFSGDTGPAISASLNAPTGVAVDGAGNLYIADTGNLRIRKVNANGIITTIAGNGSAGYSGDGGPATAAMLNLALTTEQLSVDSGGNVYIPDILNFRVRRVDAATGIITTVAGKGTQAFSGDGGSATAAGISLAFGVSVSSSNLLIADTGNGRVRKVVLNPAVGLNPTSLSFGGQIFNTTGSPQTITLTSAGGQPLSITSIVASSNFTQTNDCPISTPTAALTLNPGSTCKINVTFAPTVIGLLNGTISITDNASGSPQTVNLTGTGLSLAVVGFSTPSLTFGNQVVGTTSAAQTVTLGNTGAGPLGIASIGTTGDFAQTNDCPASLPASQSCTISVTFTPQVDTQESGSIVVTDDSSVYPHTVYLYGTGIAPEIKLSTGALDFGYQAVGTTSLAQTVTATNIGTSAMNISSITATASFAQTNDCGSTLAIGASCTISVTFAPATFGSLPGTVTINSDAYGSSATTIDLSGIGYVTRLVPQTLSFVAQPVGTTSPVQTAVFVNTGTTAVSISSVSISAGAPFAQTNTCGSSVPAGGSCTISVTFTPTAVGSAGGTLTVTSSSPEPPLSTELAGTGVTLTFSPQNFTGEDSSAMVGMLFDHQGLGTTSAAQTTTMTNQGATAIDITGITTSAPFATTNTCGTSLAAGANCTISVTFSPTSAGKASGSVSIASSAPEGTVTFTLDGVGEALQLSTGYLFFGSQAVATTSTAQAVTLTNPSASAVSISSITATGDFAPTSTCGTSIAAGANCTVSVTFAPTVAGPRSGDLNIAASASGTPQIVHLFGNTPILNLPGFTTNVLGPNDDDSTQMVPLPFTVNYFGNQYNGLFVNNNGNVTFDTYLSEFTPFSLTSTGTVIIAPFFADVYTWTWPVSALVTFGSDTVNGHPAFGVNSFAVGYYTGADKLNTFQLVLVNRSDLGAGDFDIQFNYGKVAWETGNASGGSGGLGGFSARAGFSNGTGLSGTAFELPGSAVNGGLLDSNTATGLINNRLNSTLNGQYVFNVRGGLVVPPGFAASTASLTFGDQNVGTASAAQPVIVSNTGGSLFSISSIAVSGDFTQTNNCPPSLAPGTSCTVNVAFAPTSTGALTGSLTFTDTAPGSPQAVTLSGRGVGSGVVALSTTSLSFTHNVNLSCPPKAVTVSNTGAGAVAITGISVSGPYTQTNTCGASLAAGASCQISVTFVPTAEGTFTGTLTLTDNAAGSPQTVALGGTALPPCLLQTAAKTASVVRGFATAGFVVQDPSPSCHTSTITLACAGQGPATCQFSPATMPPGGMTQLTVGNLTALAVDRLNFQATGTSGPGDTTAVDLAVLLEDFSFSQYPASATVAAGGTTSYALSLAPLNGLVGSVKLSCAGAPAGATCTVAPSTVTLDGRTPAQAKVTVTTTARSLAGPGRGPWGIIPAAPWRWLGLLALLLAATVAAVYDRSIAGWLDGRLRRDDRRARRLRPAHALLAGTLLALVAWAACGGGGLMPTASAGTPPGSYALTITGTYQKAAGQTPLLNHETTLQLKVN